MKQKLESEKTLDRALKNFVEQEKMGWCLKLLSIHISGLPDRLCLMPPGVIFFAEVKTTTQKPRAIQLWCHAKLKKIGFDVYIIDCTEDIDNLRKKYNGGI